ncbi:FecR family protein [Aestuariivivens insulae]|uniref:FecR family protein n=1 Tax=Aestuariivivens insulae TaxID=1621988 RepID=UPI001F562C26|nr:FecR family protein [Aestuariivivens insulae]
MDKKIENLITKFLVKEANLEELRQLELWISNPKNESLFLEYIKTNAFINFSVNKYDEKTAKAAIVRRIRQEKSVFYNGSKVSNLVKYAAAVLVIGMLTVTYVFRGNIFDTTERQDAIVTTTTIEVGTDGALLTLEDGSVVTLEKGESFQTQNANSNGQQIEYKPSEQATTKVAYNYLTIPRGKQFFVKLSDGTRIWLNSESQLKYPVQFVEGEKREVELIYGEAFFDVSPSTEHKGAKFTVINKAQEVEVLGTEFNIKAYKDEDHVYTTLVEGKVEVNASAVKQILKPNEQSNVNKLNNSILVEVVDAKAEIAWKDGIFSFKGKPLKAIMKVLSRWYDIDVVFENKDLETIKFKGNLFKDQPIDEILSIMKSSTINNYEIKDKTLIIK